MDHHAKLDWASRHIDALVKAISDFANDNPYHVVRKLNLKPGEHEASVVNVKPTPPDWSLMVGDIVHELRSALDNLTYALAVKHSGAARADTSTRLQFPIADTEQGWTRQEDRIALLSSGARTVIQGLQPCYRFDKTDPHFLSVLRDLSNRDKHRSLILTIVKAVDVDIFLSGTGIPAGAKIKSAFRGPLEEDTVIAAWHFDPPRDVPDMQVYCNSVIDVEFGEGPAERQPVRGLLEWFRNGIRDDVLPPLDKLLV